MQTEENKAFWSGILAYIQAQGEDRLVQISRLRIIAKANTEARHRLTDLSSLRALQLGQEHDAHWTKMRNFFEHPAVREWTPELTLRQLTLAASGERGVGLHDNCIELPLYS